MDTQEENITLKIEKLIYGGHGIAYTPTRKTVFLSNVAPGELVETTIDKQKKGSLWAKPLKIIEPNAELRVQERCSHTHECGGCSYQHLNYSAQIKAKEQILLEIYKNYDLPKQVLEETIKSPQQFYYRNKCEFSFGNNSSGSIDLGLHPPGKYFEVLNLKECHLLPTFMWEILQECKKLVNESGLEVFRDLKDEGFWSTVAVRYSFSSQDALLVWKVKDPNSQQLKQISQELVKKFPKILGILAQPAQKVAQNEENLLQICGINTISESIGDVNFVYQAENFFQINISVLPLLMARIVELVNLVQPDIVYDLFGGVGAIGICVAKQIPSLKKVIGAEADKMACKMASFNAELNSITNYESHYFNLYKRGWGKAIKLDIKNYGNQKQKICAIIDPPRGGLSGKTVRDLSDLSPDSIIYVSCNPSTQRRDVELLAELGYKMKNLQLIDMFPQTFHLESIALLEKY
ncbi:MAG: 23S rRNA (uracil(1939)-C(5))-methyltransferase RlmD [Candidatus Caenarcaniphilales bacterium]|nr:23S rRNA (uracil(1939)-C(5))-methyltransferase RlmD [Candidatus Caenarcaniphilales bacterium]